MRYVLMDFETESTCDLKKSGAWVYSEHPTTNIICLGLTFDGTEAVIYPAPELVYGRREPIVGYLEEAVADLKCMFIAHNVGFEKAIWRNIMMPVFGWPDIPNDRWHDTQAVCAMKGLPLKLERAAMALRLSNLKDTDGTKATLALGRTNKKGYYDHAPDRLQRVYDYCKLDVRAELELHKRVHGLGAAERKVWLLDQTINERGVRLDMEFVRAAQFICDDASRPLRIEFEKLTGLSKVASPKFKDWLVAQGCPFPLGEDGKPAINLQKETVAKLLGDLDEDENDLVGDDEDFGTEDPQFHLPFAYRRPLEIRSILGSASIKKLAAMEACCASDGRAHGLLQYHGTSTGLWSGRLLQPQNFPRPNIKVVCGFDEHGAEIFEGHDPEQLVAAIKSGDAEFVRLLYGEPIKAVVNGLRHAIIASPGKVLEAGDFKQLQARIVLALAGQHDKTALMASGQNPYIPMAEAIYKRKINKKTDLAEYTIGKNTILGCGFQMGWKKFLRRYAPTAGEDFGRECVTAYREVYAPEVPKLWRGLEQAAIKCVWDRVPTQAYGIEYRLEDGWLTARLPSGRRLWYYDPMPIKRAMPWDKDDIRPGFSYMTRKMGQWIRRAGYGGQETQNIVSGIARDLLVSGMFNCENGGFPVVFNVHDECIDEVPEAKADAKFLDQRLCDVPEWAKWLRIPIETDCWVGPRYRK